MDGYEVVTIDGDKIGHVVDEQDGYLVVEHGLRKTKHALPLNFTEVVDGERVVLTTLSKHIVHDSPKVNGELDRTAVAEHYGLAEGYDDPPTRGQGDLLPDDPAFGADDGSHARARLRSGMARGDGAHDRGNSPGLTGGDRYKDYPRDRSSD
jgi:hypothetical protein